MFVPLLFYSLRFYAALWMISLAMVENNQYTLFRMLCQLLKSNLETSNIQIESILSIWIKFFIKIIFSYLKNSSPICGTVGLIEPLVFNRISKIYYKTEEEFTSFFSLMIIMWNNSCRCRISFQLQMTSVFNVKIITKFEMQC